MMRRKIKVGIFKVALDDKVSDGMRIVVSKMS
jgi:hypothetical protein